METVLYDVNQKKKKSSAFGVKAGLRRFLVLGWGIVCSPKELLLRATNYVCAHEERVFRAKAPQSFLALGRRFGCRAGVRISLLTPNRNLLRSLRGRQACAYAYLKSPFTFTRGCLPNQPPGLPTYRHFLLGVANGLIILALAGLILTFYPLLRAELSYKVKNISQKEPPTARAYFGDLLTSEVSLAAEGGNSSTSEVLGITAPDPTFSLVIPKIDAKAKIIANVDPADEAAYNQALKVGVAHAVGWGFPGRGETIWLFAHSTDTPWNISRYNAVFYLLRMLEPGDQVIVFFNQKRFNYQVFDKIVVEPSNVSFLENQGEELLALQTCWPPGTTLKRLIVLARPAS